MKPINKTPSLLTYRSNGIPPTKMPLYPTMNSLEEVVNLANSKIPVVHRNEMVSLLMTYQNTLLKQLEKRNAG